MIYVVAFLGGLFLSLAFDLSLPRFFALLAGIYCIAWVVSQW